MKNCYNFFLTALCVAFLSACASNQETVAEPADAATAGAAEQVAAVENERDPNAMKCKKYTPTGSRIGNRVCKTNAEWDEAARMGREVTDHVQNQSLQGAAGPAGQ